MLNRRLGILLTTVLIVSLWMIPTSMIQASGTSEAQVGFYKQSSSVTSSSSAKTDYATQPARTKTSSSSPSTITTMQTDQIDSGSRGWLPQTGEEVGQWVLIGLGLLLLALGMIAGYEYVRWQRQAALLEDYNQQ